MINREFSELVNLYLDKEISNADLALLKTELSSNPDRKVELKELCRMHHAMRIALSGGDVEAYENEMAELLLSNARTMKYTRWICGTSLAAAIAIVGVLVFPMLSTTLQIAEQSTDELAGLEVPMFVIDQSDLSHSGNAHVVRRRVVIPLAAEMRLLGLHPEVVTEESPLSEVSYASTQPKDVTRRRVVVLNQLREYRPIPEPVILESGSAKPSGSLSWPAGFQTSLASY
ncbi:MAG: hypothetical protein ACSHX8_15670 [Opitutaceae bacterium]